MNIRPPRKLINLLLLVLLFMSVISCKNQKGMRIVEMFKGVEIENLNYEHSNNSIFRLNNVTYSLRQKVIYNEKGEFERFILYKPEGMLEYDKKELLKDKNLIDYYDLSFKQNWFYKDGTLTIESNKIKVLKIEDTFLITEENGVTIFYKLAAGTPSASD